MKAVNLTIKLLRSSSNLTSCSRIKLESYLCPLSSTEQGNKE